MYSKITFKDSMYLKIKGITDNIEPILVSGDLPVIKTYRKDGLRVFIPLTNDIAAVTFHHDSEDD